MSITETMRKIREQVAEGKFPQVKRYAVTGKSVHYPPKQKPDDLPDMWSWNDHPKD